MSRSWFNGWYAKEIIKSDNLVFNDLMKKYPLLRKGNSSVSDREYGFVLTRKFHFKSVAIEYHYPELLSEGGIHIRILRNSGLSTQDSAKIVELRIRPIEIRHQFLRLILEYINEKKIQT
jgi:hypothetical protein